VKALPLALVASLVVTGAQAAGMTSAYTDLDLEKSCKTLAKAEEGEGSWVSLDCPGYGSYRVRVMEDDLRQSVSYGPELDQPAWESFGAFNHAGPKIEWRLSGTTPFAAIHRWFVSGGDGKPDTEVLVVEKVGQPSAAGGCAVALVRASGVPEANELARKAADDEARAFTCGKDQPRRIGKVPDFGREAY